jgi:hypothetical protein
VRPVDEIPDEGEALIDEIRAVREEISARFGHDPARLVAYYIERQNRHPERLLRTAAPRSPDPAT